MNSFFGPWLDLVAALGLIIALCSIYARIRRFVRHPRLGQILLGLSFGCVALFEMYHPIEPFDGLIIDLRNVPIALAGAFLSWPAALVTTAVGLVARASIGGVGMMAGMLGMLIAVGAGILWAQMFRDSEHRGLGPGLILAVMMSIHLIPAVILPSDLAYWFFAVAAPSVFALNLLTVPLLALILEGERKYLDMEHALRAGAVVDRDTGLLPLPALQRECEIRSAALGDGSFSHAMIVTVRSTHPLSIWNTQVMQKRLVAAMRMRLSSALPHCDLASVVGSSSLVLPLTQVDMLSMSDTKMAVRRAATEDPYALTGRDGHRIAVDLHVIDISSEKRMMTGLAKASAKVFKPRFGATKPWVRRVDGEDERFKALPRHQNANVEGLFAKADFLMTRNGAHGERSR